MAADGSVVIDVNLNAGETEKELKRLIKKIQTLNDLIYIKQKQKMPLVEQSRQLAAVLDEAKAKLYSMQNGTTGWYTQAQIKQQADAVRQLQKEWDSVQSKVESYDTAIQKARLEIDLSKEQAGTLQQRLASAGAGSKQMASAMKKAQKSVTRFSLRLKEVIRSALIFTVISQGLASLREWLGKVILTNDEAKAAIAKLKGALLTLAQPLVEVLLPAITAFSNILADVVASAAKLVSGLFGKTADDSAEAAENLYEETEAIEGVGDAAEDASKPMASFDEINKLSGGETSKKDSSSGEIAPDFSAFDDEEYKSKLDEITAYVSGALLALGAILAFSGANIPLGIALMAAGAVGLASEISENWGAMNEKVKNAINMVMITLGAAALVIGAILTFSGVNIPLGITLMAIGAAALWGAAALNWNNLSDSMKAVITGILVVLGISLLAIGAVIAFSGVNIPLGIGLMVAGAIALAAAAALNWEMLSGNISQVVFALLAIVGSALLVIGGVLAFSGANIPLGIGLMVAGAVALGAAVALNWESLSGNMKSIALLLLEVLGGALLAVGGILAFSGANIPLGIGLMIAGAVALGAAATLSWDELSGSVKAVITTILEILGAALLVIGAVLAFTGANIPLGIGLMVAGAVGLAATAALNWNVIQENIGSVISEILKIAGTSLLALGIVLAFTGAALPLGLALMAAGGAALFASSNVDWNALLDSLKGVWGSIVDWWNTNVAKYFTLDFWTELGSNMVEGLMNGLASIFSKIAEWGSSVMDSIKSFFGFDTSAESGSLAKASAPSVVRSVRFSVPALASGAVIPPNRQFLAVLGDQTDGTNVEAPLSTIKQAVAEVLSQHGNNQGGDIILQIDGAKFARITNPYNAKENTRVGIKLVNGVM